LADEADASAPEVTVEVGPGSVEAVYLDAYPRLVALARTILADADGAEEVVQEAFTRSLSRWGRRRDRDDALRYVRSAVINLCRSRFRRKVVPLRAAPSEASAEAAAVSHARRDAVLSALAALPARQREVVALRYFGGLSTVETSQELGIAEGTVKAHLHRGLAALRAPLEDHRG
jgi:RNA polymerase sigma-70 factor (sigma-E family)